MEFLFEVVGLQGLRINVTDNQVIYTYICTFLKSVPGDEVYAADIRSLQSASIPCSLGSVFTTFSFFLPLGIDTRKDLESAIFTDSLYYLSDEISSSFKWACSWLHFPLSTNPFPAY